MNMSGNTHSLNCVKKKCKCKLFDAWDSDDDSVSPKVVVYAPLALDENPEETACPHHHDFTCITTNCYTGAESTDSELSDETDPNLPTSAELRMPSQHVSERPGITPGNDGFVTAAFIGMLIFSIYNMIYNHPLDL